MTPPESRDAGHITTVRFPREMYDALEALAHCNHRSVSGEIRVAVEAHIAATTKANKRKWKPVDGALAR